MIAIRADGNMDIGMGHLMRCMCIAQELVQMEVKVIFLPSPDTEIDILLRQGFQVLQLKEIRTLGWDLKETLNIIQQKKIDLLIVDSYRTSLEDFKALRKYTKVLYLDDLYSYDADVDIIINCNIDADCRMYFNSQIKDRKVFAGIEYFPLRKEFDQYLNNPIREKIANVLITTGSTDPFRCIYQITKSLTIGCFPQINFNVLLGKFYPESYIKELKNHLAQEKNVYFISWGGDIAKIISTCDLVISSGSSTVFEALSIGVPCITFQFAENHNTECVELDKLGMAPWAGIYDFIQDEATNKHLRELFIMEFDFSIRKLQYNAFSQKFNGKGLQRIIEIICEIGSGFETPNR